MNKMEKRARVWARFIERLTVERGTAFDEISIVEDSVLDEDDKPIEYVTVRVHRDGFRGESAVSVHSRFTIVFHRRFGGGGGTNKFDIPSDFPHEEAIEWIDGLLKWAGDDRLPLWGDTKYAYTGQPMLTRGDLGENVEVVHRGRWEDGPAGFDEFVPDVSGDDAAVFDAAFGFLPLGSFRRWDEDGVLSPL